MQRNRPPSAQAISAPGYTFYDVIVSVTPLWALLVQVIVVPVLVGVAGTLWGGSAAAAAHRPARGFQGVAPRGSSRAAKMHPELAKLKASRRWVMSHTTSVSAVSGSLQSPP